MMHTSSIQEEKMISVTTLNENLEIAKAANISEPFMPTEFQIGKRQHLLSWWTTTPDGS